MAVLAQPKRAGLLAFLALSHPGDFHRRDALLATFWPELDQRHGRAALSQALSYLRRELGDGVVVTRGVEEVGIDTARLESDVGAFDEALAGEDWARAVALYQGELLEGLHVSGCVSFTDWVDRERERLREAAAGAAWKRAHQLLSTGEPTEAERVAQRALDLVPTDESQARVFIEALAGAGDRAAALRFYEKFSGILERELEVGPAPETVAVMEAVRRKGESLEARRAELPAGDPAARDSDTCPRADCGRSGAQWGTGRPGPPRRPLAPARRDPHRGGGGLRRLLTGADGVARWRHHADRRGVGGEVRPGGGGGLRGVRSRPGHGGRRVAARGARSVRHPSPGESLRPSATRCAG